MTGLFQHSTDLFVSSFMQEKWFMQSQADHLMPPERKGFLRETVCHQVCWLSYCFFWGFEHHKPCPISTIEKSREGRNLFNSATHSKNNPDVPKALQARGKCDEILMWTAPFSMWLNWLKPKGWRDLWHRVPASFTLDPLTPPLWSVPPSRPTVYLARTSRADNEELQGRQEDTPPASRHPRWCLHVNVI